jgi:hypothetical protein
VKGPAPHLVAFALVRATFAGALARSWHAVAALAGATAGMQAALAWREWRRSGGGGGRG